MVEISEVGFVVSITMRGYKCLFLMPSLFCHRFLLSFTRPCFPPEIILRMPFFAFNLLCPYNLNLYLHDHQHIHAHTTNEIGSAGHQRKPGVLRPRHMRRNHRQLPVLHHCQRRRKRLWDRVRCVPQSRLHDLRRRGQHWPARRLWVRVIEERKNAIVT